MTPGHYILDPRPPMSVRDAYSLTLKVLTAAGCVYEIAALPERSPLPTISDLVSNPYRHRFGWAVWAFWIGAWLSHFRPRGRWVYVPE